MPLLLPEADLANLLHMEALVDLMERTLAQFSTGRALQPVRTVMRIAEHGAALGVMPGYLAEDDALAVKLVSVTPGNAARGLPTHLATVALIDPATGRLLALLDGRLITEMRTAAVSAAAARALARPEASTLALLGSGVQAVSHLEALCVVRRIREVRVHSRTPEHREAFAREQSERRGVPVRAVRSAEEAVRGADLVVTATASREPVLFGDWLAPGACVMAVGCCFPDARELDADVVQESRVFVDSLAAARVEAGDLVLAVQDGAFAWERVAGEIGAVFAGAVPGRTRSDEIVLFKSLGLAVEDAATAQHAYRLARENGIGREVEV